MEKLQAFLAMCRDEGVRTGPLRVDGEGGSCCVVPLLSWHHQSFDTEPDITCWEGIPRPEHAMVDYSRCKWPSPLSQTDESVARALDELNDRGPAFPEGAGAAALPIISFSHFVPRFELNPEKRFLFLPCLLKAVGSRFLGERVQRIGSAMHGRARVSLRVERAPRLHGDWRPPEGADRPLDKLPWLRAAHGCALV
mmetsp:Transcript_55661/g.180664  ORF Transcript_55661/g.180664 Transcript_55661/m.180664 type:complete len:196 (-) Transcript_55661:152-739(-)